MRTVTSNAMDSIPCVDQDSMSDYMSYEGAAAFHRTSLSAMYLAAEQGRILSRSVEIVPGKSVNLLLRESVIAYRPNRSRKAGRLDR